MPLSAEQIKFINREAKGKTLKEIKDLIGLLYKGNIRKFIKSQREPKSLADILKKAQDAQH